MNEVFAWAIRTGIVALSYSSSKILIKCDTSPEESIAENIKNSLWVIIVTPIVAVMVFSAVVGCGTLSGGIGPVEISVAYIGAISALIKTIITNQSRSQ